MDKKLQAKRMVWAYLLEHGVETTGEWSYYGGRFDAVDPKQQYACFDGGLKSLIERSRLVGVDWDKTTMPDTGSESEFNGTFSEATRVETLLGTIHFRDGSSAMVGAAGENLSVSKYVRALAEMSVDEARVDRIFGE